MRIVAGEFGGRRLAVPKDPRVRPTADRVREAWMSILADALAGRPGARPLRRQRRARPRGALPRRRLGHVRRAQSAVAPALKANIDGARRRATGPRCIAATRCASSSGSRPARSTSRSPIPPTPGTTPTRLVALFRPTPFARILSVEHRAAERLDGDETRRYGDTALTFCHAP